jgi:TldD protein
MNAMPDASAIDRLRSLISSSSGASYVEARYQERLTTEVNFVNGELERIRVVENTGCGIRVLVDGCWGFSSTNNLSLLKESLAHAVSAARVLSRTKKNRVKGLAESKMTTGTFRTGANGNLSDVDIEQKVQVAKEGEKAARSNKAVKTASCTYRETLDHKAIVNSDGADVEIFDSKPEFNVVAIARKARPPTRGLGLQAAGATSSRKAIWNTRLSLQSGLQNCLTQST